MNKQITEIMLDQSLKGVELARLVKENASLRAELEAAREALADMLGGWRYIRRVHGDLYGVGWDRAQKKVEAALAAISRKEGES